MQEIEFTKDLNEMNDAELRATLREFRTEYNEGKDDYDELQSKVSEYKRTIEEQARAEKQLADLKPRFASMFAEMKDLDEELVEEKFSVEELVEDLEAAGAFQFEPSPEKETPEEEDETTFTEKEQKSRKPEDKSEHQDRIDRFFKERKMVRTY